MKLNGASPPVARNSGQRLAQNTVAAQKARGLELDRPGAQLEPVNIKRTRFGKLVDSLRCFACAQKSRTSQLSTFQDSVVSARKTTAGGWNLNFRDESGQAKFADHLAKLQSHFPILDSISLSEQEHSAHFPFTKYELTSLFNHLGARDNLPSDVSEALQDLSDQFERLKPGGWRVNRYNADVKQSQDFKKAVADLNDEANAFFTEYRAKSSKGLPTDKTLSSKLTQADSPKALLSAAFKGNQGITIGETHHSKASKKILMDNMSTLKAAGVKTLFLEHLLTDFHSAELDLFFNAPRGAPMPDGLKAHLGSLDSGYLLSGQAYTFTHLVQSAKDNGLRVVPFDNTASYDSLNTSRQSETNDRQRYSLMNYQAQRVIGEEGNVGKWVALVGSAHLTEHLGVPGVADLTNTPAIIVQDKHYADQGDDFALQVGRQAYLDTEIQPDVVVTLKAD